MTEALLGELTALLGPGGVLRGDDVIQRSSDPFRNLPIAADAILRPRSTDEVSAVLRAASAAGVPIITHGGRTGVSGGADSQAGEIVLSLERMNHIEEVNPVSRILVAEGGATIQQIQEAAEAADLFYPVDLGARGSATVGGTISTNAGGNRTLRWGMTRDRVLGLEAVLPDGTIIPAMHRLIKNNTGYDIKHLFIGSEGTLGIITRAIFRLVSKPTSHDVALIALPDYTSVLKLLDAAQRLSSLSAFELMYADYYEIVTSADPAARPLPTGSMGYVLVESMGYDAEMDRGLFEAFLGRIHEMGISDGIVLAQSDQQAKAIWKIRESVEIAVRQLAPILTFDVSLDVVDIDSYVTDVRHALQARFPGGKMIVNGHVGDNNIHLGITTGSDTATHETEIDEIVYHGLTPYGGAMSAEHGIGTTKNDWLSISRSATEIDLMKTIKRSIDPARALNPRVLFR